MALVPLFNRYLLSTYYVPGTESGVRDKTPHPSLTEQNLLRELEAAISQIVPLMKIKLQSET